MYYYSKKKKRPSFQSLLFFINLQTFCVLYKINISMYHVFILVNINLVVVTNIFLSKFTTPFGKYPTDVCILKNICYKASVEIREGDTLSPMD